MDIQGAFSGYSVGDIEAAKKFYHETLGLAITEDMGGISLQFPGGQQIFMYPKEDHEPATYTVLNIVVNDINAAVNSLMAKGVAFERYDNLPGPQDEHGVLRGKDAGMGPNIAWFTDPSGNILALVEE
ncbi:MAG TPA: VOC family protein [Dongiaceae bacterium]|nr:VOC family protein [Dongiaceae bacterium]